MAVGLAVVGPVGLAVGLAVRGYKMKLHRNLRRKLSDEIWDRLRLLVWWRLDGRLDWPLRQTK